MGGGDYFDFCFTDPHSHDQSYANLLSSTFRSEKANLDQLSANDADSNPLPVVGDTLESRDLESSGEMIIESDKSLSSLGAEKSGEISDISMTNGYSEGSAALLIQSVFRGHLVRREEPLKYMRIIDGVRKDLSLLKAEFCWDEEVELDTFSSQHQKLKLTESLTALLLRLDVVQSSNDVVRFARKAVAKSINSILDSIEPTPICTMVPTASVSAVGNHPDISAKSGNSQIIGDSVELENSKLIDETKTIDSESESESVMHSIQHQQSEAVPEPFEASEEVVETLSELGEGVSSSDSEELKDMEITAADFGKIAGKIITSDAVKIEEVTAPGAASGATSGATSGALLGFAPGAIPGAASGAGLGAFLGVAPGAPLDAAAGADPGAAPGADASVKAKDALATRDEMESLKNRITYLEALTIRLVEENRSLQSLMEVFVTEKKRIDGRHLSLLTYVENLNFKIEGLEKVIS